MHTPPLEQTLPLQQLHYMCLSVGIELTSGVGQRIINSSFPALYLYTFTHVMHVVQYYCLMYAVGVRE